jgi:hypothetical protein
MQSQLQWMHQDEAPNCRAFINWMNLKNQEVGLKTDDYKWLQIQLRKHAKMDPDTPLLPMHTMGM